MNRYINHGLRCPACDSLLTKKEKLVYNDSDGFCLKCDTVIRELRTELTHPVLLKNWIKGGLKRGMFNESDKQIYGNETALRIL